MALAPTLTPVDELGRLRALYSCRLLDTPSETAFDDLTALAARLCDTPIALVSLVDRDRQWFKSRRNFALTETPRDVSFCGHAICEPGTLMVVPDATRDSRFADSPLVTGEEGIRFYAGMPLTTTEGHPVGTLCVMDRVPRELTPEQEESLCMLARQAASQLELRRALNAVDASEAQFRGLCDSAPIGIFQGDAQGCMTYANPAFLAICQRSAAELFDLKWLNIIHPDDRPALLERVEKTYQGSGDALSEGVYRILRPDGTARWIHAVSKAFQRDAAGNVLSRVGTIDDITEKYLAGITVRESEERYRKLHELSPDGLFVQVNGRITLVNPALCRMLGADRPEQLLGKSLWDLIHPDFHALVRSRIQLINAGLSVEPVDQKYLRLDGTILDVEVVAAPIFRDSGIEMQVILRDITQRKRDEATLRENAALLRALIESSLDGILLVDNSGRKIIQNRRTAELWKIPPEVVADPDDRKQVAFVMSQTRHPDAFVAQVRHLYAHPDETSRDEIELKDGTVLDRYSSPVLGEDGTRYGRIWAFRDITARKAAEAALSASEERFKLVARAVSDVLWDYDVRTGATWRSKSYEQIFGLGSATSADDGWLDHIHPEDRVRITASLDQALAGAAKIWDEEYRFRLRDGTYAEVRDRSQIIRDETGRAIRMVGGMSDLTEQKKLEAQYLRAQRMESIGTLAGGIAHDLNNVLTPVLLSIGMLRENLGQDREGIQILETIESSAQRGASLVRQVLSFARGFGGERSLVDLRRLLIEIERIMQETFPRSIRLSVVRPSVLWLAPGDATQLHQVLMNLALNARDAMPQGGRLSLSVENLALDRSSAGIDGEPRSGPHVLIKVSDTGHGIAPDIRDRIFEPFFTTKEVGQGTGLGLSTVHAIVKSHGGFVNVQSEPGHGTTFTVGLPASPAPSAADVRPADDAELPRGRGELILVIDDEAPIRTVGQRMLEKHGYRVLTAADGAAGLAVFTQEADNIAAVIIDMMMPVMDGPTAIRAMLRLRPATRLIAVSGLNAAGQIARAVQAGAKDCLAKPYTAGEMLRLVRAVLDRPTPVA
jgi:PAS domain S-box-containing protein